MIHTNRIEEAKHILTMIENVDKDDVKALDKIDGYVELLSKNLCPMSVVVETSDLYSSRIITRGHDANGCVHQTTHCGTLSKYTRSRDALKAIRLDGWGYKLATATLGEFNCELWIRKNTVRALALPTEELAELSAILQSYIWEWENE